MYKAIQFSDKHVFVNYFDKYGMDILGENTISIRRVSKEDLKLIEESRVSKNVEEPSYYSKEVKVKPEWKFIMDKGISLLEGLEKDRMTITL